MHQVALSGSLHGCQPSESWVCSTLYILVYHAFWLWTILWVRDKFHSRSSHQLIIFYKIGVHSELLGLIDIVSQFPNGSLLYDKQSIRIKCTTHGTQIQAWRSEEYIGSGGQLVLAFTMMKGANDTSQIMPQTFAILTGATNEGGNVQLESELHLTVTLNKSFTITCIHVDQTLMESITYHISGKYALHYYKFILYS